MMKTDVLIDRLSANLAPVRRVFPISVAYCLWIGSSLLILISYIWWRSDFFRMIHIPIYIYELIPAFLVLLISAYNAIHTSIPGNRKIQYLSLAPISFLVLWMCLLLFRFFTGITSDIPIYNYHTCIRDFLLMNLPTSIGLIYIIRRRYPMSKKNIGFWIFTASATMSALGEAFLCPNEAASHLILIHLFPVFGLSLLGIWIGNFVFHRELDSTF
ncbi:NrsF family protein [Leptospira vanthielii]